MRTINGLLIMLLVLMIMVVGCGTQGNSALKNLGVIPSDKTIAAVIVNQPSAAELGKVSNLVTYDSDTSQAYLLLLPVQNGSVVEVVSLLWRDDNLQDDQILYKVDKTKDGYGLLLRAERPCGMPWLKIRISNKAGYAEYLIAEDGQFGTPTVEYIKWAP